MTRATVGKAWIVSARTSIGVSVLIARTASWIASEAPGPARNAPRRRLVPRSTTIVAWPSASATYPFAEVARSAVHSRGSWPAARASATVSPTPAVSGSVYVARGIARKSGRTSSPRAIRTTIAFVVGEVGVELGAGGVAGDVDAVRDPEPIVGSETAVDELDPEGLEPERGEQWSSPDGEENLVALGDRAVGKNEPMRLAERRRGFDPDRPGPEPQLDPVGGKGSGEGGRVVRVVAVVEALLRVDDRDRDAVAGEDLPELDARGAAAQDDEAPRQLAGRGRLAVRPGPDPLETGQVGDGRPASDGDDDVPGLEDRLLAGRGANGHPAGADEPRLAPDDPRAGRLEGPEVPAVVGPLAPLPVDHVVAPVRGPRPRVVAAEGVVPAAWRRVFDGMQAQKGQLPPRSSRSTTVTLAPRRRASWAAASPAAPAPMTTKSSTGASSLVGRSLVRCGSSSVAVDREWGDPGSPPGSHGSVGPATVGMLSRSTTSG